MIFFKIQTIYQKRSHIITARVKGEKFKYNILEPGQI